MQSLYLLAAFCCISLCLGQTSVELATCYMRGTTADPGITGTVRFFRVGNDIQAVASLTGITVRTGLLHGMHIHNYGDISAPDATSSDLHYNPTGNTHGCPPNTPRHTGDMGNWTVSAGGLLSQSKTVDLVTLTGGESIIGRAVLLHEGADDCGGATGNAGGRLAQCVIGIDDADVNEVNIAVAPTVTSAICVLVPTSGNNVTGTIILTQNSTTESTRIYAEILGLDGNPHGFHIHQYGDVASASGNLAGGHYNPFNVAHGIPPYEPRHVGDMGLIYHYVNGTAYYDYSNDQINLNGVNNVVGRTIIVHEMADVCTTGTGGAGNRLAQCVIGIKNPLTTLNFPDGVPATQDDSPCVELYATTGTATTDTPATTATADDDSLAIVSHKANILLVLVAVLAGFVGVTLF